MTILKKMRNMLIITVAAIAALISCAAGKYLRTEEVRQAETTGASARARRDNKVIVTICLK